MTVDYRYADQETKTSAVGHYSCCNVIVCPIPYQTARVQDELIGVDVLDSEGDSITEEDEHQIYDADSKNLFLFTVRYDCIVSFPFNNSDALVLQRLVCLAKLKWKYVRVLMGTKEGYTR